MNGTAAASGFVYIYIGQIRFDRFAESCYWAKVNDICLREKSC